MIYFERFSKYNQGGLRAVIDRILWMNFVKKSLENFYKEFGKLNIHACDLMLLIPLRNSPKKNNVKILFDIFDWFSDTFSDQDLIVTTAFKYMERFSVQNSDHIILCENKRRIQVPYDIDNKYSVLPNIQFL